MDSLPDDTVQNILSYVNNAQDVALCNCVSKRWKDSIPSIRSLIFPSSSFLKLKRGGTPDAIILKMISLVEKLENLVVHCPFSGAALVSWLAVIGPSLKCLELQINNFAEEDVHNPSKLDCLTAAKSLESLKLYGVLMTCAPKWDVFRKLKNLEIVRATANDPALSTMLRACPNLTELLLLNIKGVVAVSIELPLLKQCKFSLCYDFGNCSFSMNCPKIEDLELQRCSSIRVQKTKHLKNLSISNRAESVHVVDFDKLEALESLTISGDQWSWGAISSLLQQASEVKHLYMMEESRRDLETLNPFPEFEFVDFFNNHPKLQRFEMHGAMFDALCQKTSLINVDSDFVIPCLEEVGIAVRSPINAEQKMSTLESLLRFGKKLKSVKIEFLPMIDHHGTAEVLLNQLFCFSALNEKIVRIV